MAVITIGKTGVGGLVKDIPPEILPPEIFSHSRNIRYRNGAAEKVMGDQIVFGSPLISPEFVTYFPPSTAPNWVYGNTSRLFVANGSQHSEITRETSPYLGNARDRWQASLFNNVGIFNNGADIPQQWLNFSSGTRLENLANFPENIRCSSIRPHKNFLFALNIRQIALGAEAPFRVGWSDAAPPGQVPSNWSIGDPASRAGETDLAETPDHIVDGFTLGEIFIIYKESSTWAARFVGGNSVFAFGRVLESSGLLTKGCFAPIKGGHVVVTQRDMIVHNGQLNGDRSLLNDKLRRWVFNNIDPTNFYKSFVVARDEEVWFCFPEVGQENPNLAVIWNIEDNTVGIRDIPPATSGASGAITVDGVSSFDDPWDGQPALTWDPEVPNIWNEPSLDSRELHRTVFASPTLNALVEVDRIDNSSTVTNAILERTQLTISGQDRQGAPIVDPQVVKFVRWFYPLIEGKEGECLEIALGYQNNNNEDIIWLPAVSFVIGKSFRVPAFFSTRTFSFRIISTHNTPWKFMGYKVDLDAHGVYQ